MPLVFRRTDFLNLEISPPRTGIFNVADLAITAGLFILQWPVIRGNEDNKTESAAEPVTSAATSTLTA